MQSTSIPLSPALGLLVLSVIVGIVVGTVIWRHRPDPGAVELTVMMASLVVWAGIYAIGLVTYDEPTRRLIERVMWIGIATAPVAWVAFALAYTGHSRALTRRSVALLCVVPAITFALVLTNPAHHLVWTNVDVVVTNDLAIAVQDYGPWFWVYATYGYGLVLLGAGLVVRLAVTAKTLYADQAVALIVGAIVPAVANLASVLGVAPLPGLDMTPYALAVAGAAFSYAIVQYRLFDLLPATRRLGRDALIDNMRDAVVIADRDGRIVDLNPVATAAFDADRDAVLGEPVAALLGSAVTVPGPDETSDVTGADGTRTYELRAAPIENWQGNRVGDVLVLRDVTERVLQQQRLSVLNRVIRHNLRNDVTVIRARAEAIMDALSGADAEHAATISETATNLADLSEKARTFDRIVESGGSESHVDVIDVVHSVVATVRETFPDVTVQVTASGAHRITCADPGFVELVVHNLVENAAEHNDAAAPIVEVMVERSDETADEVDGDVDEVGVVVTVADNGPTIPEHERAVLDAQEETALVHGTGLGLWTASWCVRRLGGEMGFSQRSERGNIVTVEIPGRPPSGDPTALVRDETADA